MSDELIANSVIEGVAFISIIGTDRSTPINLVSDEFSLFATSVQLILQ